MSRKELDSENDSPDHKYGMALEKYLQATYFYSGEASKINRQLAFAGIAIIWIFYSSKNPELIPRGMQLPLLLLVIGLAVDLLQYVMGYILLKIFHRKHEAKRIERGGIKENILAPSSIDKTIM